MKQPDETTEPKEVPPQQVRLVDTKVTSQHDAFQLFINFLNLAQKRGTFTIDESAKIYECINMFRH